MAVLRSFLQNIAFLADINRGGCYDFLTDRIDRRVRYLCKELFEIVEQRLMFFRKHGKRAVSTHGRYRLGTIQCHRQDHGLILLVGVTIGLLQLCTLLLRKPRHPIIRDRKIL